LLASVPSIVRTCRRARGSKNLKGLWGAFRKAAVLDGGKETAAEAEDLEMALVAATSPVDADEHGAP
jgi:hypothetical protein